MQIAAAPAVLGLALCGTLVVYSIDRLRDVDRDRDTAPDRTAFVTRHAGALRVLALCAAALAGACGFVAGPGVVATAGGVAVLGLAHRRLKRFVWVKPLYLTVAWTTVAVALPAVAGSDARNAGWVASIVAGTVLSNVVLSNLRDGEGAAVRLGALGARIVAAAPLLPSLLAALLAPEPVRPLVWLPLSMAAVLPGFRPSERYGLWIVDGALLAGACLALL